MSVTGSEVWAEGSWWEALPHHPLFVKLKESHEEHQGNDKALLCESRGDLFVWSSNLCCLLTTNLKRLQARRDEASVFQYLHPTALPVEEVVSIAASPSGQHVALCCKESVLAMALRRQRGPSGEFSGGVPEVDCRSTPIASGLLRAHCLHVVQMHWIQNDSEMMVILTSDGMLRLCSVSHPTTPLSTICALAGPGHSPHMLHLEEDGGVVGFVIWQDRALLLHERLDVQAIALQPGAVPTPPLPIYPLSEDNYSGSGCTLLLLETTPPVLVIATDGGRLHHCIYLYQPVDQDEGEELLSVVESVALPVEHEEAAAEELVRLFPDPMRRDCYVVLNSVGLFQIQLPWIGRMDNVSEVGFVAEPGSIVQQLFCPAESVLDVTVVSDHLLGSVATVLLTSYECIAFPLNIARDAVPRFAQLPGTKPDTSTTAGVLLHHIHSLLQVADVLASPLHRREGRKVDSGLSQQESLEYLQLSIEQLRHRYLAPQTRAKAELSARIDILARRKHRQLDDLSALMDQCQDLSLQGEELGERMEGVRQRCSTLVDRLERLLGAVATCSPVLSNAEQNMAQELRSIHDQLHATSRLLDKAQAKVQLGLAGVAGDRGTLRLGSVQVDTLFSSLSDDGRHIKEAVQQVKDLTAFAES